MSKENLNQELSHLSSEELAARAKLPAEQWLVKPANMSTLEWLSKVEEANKGI